ncbi:NAD(P)-dependent oxidoreductase [Candidatus Dojkabacteria bacterium]|nr:NAD(P)-dependent oxidoreductase [Candidatus Dojkabacteria bacterium]
MKILITGANGRIGQHLIQKLNTKGHFLILTSIEEKPRRVFGNTVYYQADLTKPEQIQKVVSKEKPDAVIHLGGLLPDQCQKNYDLAYKINTQATKDLAKICADNQTKRFIFSSTSAVYPQNSKTALKESDANPQSNYGKTKFLAEQELERIAPTSKMQVIIFRIFNIYGPGFEESLINKLKRARKSKEQINLYELDKFARDYIHIDDVIDFLIKALTLQEKQIFNVINLGTSRAFYNSDLINLAAKLGWELDYKIVPLKDESIVFADNLKTQEVFPGKSFRKISL